MRERNRSAKPKAAPATLILLGDLERLRAAKSSAFRVAAFTLVRKLLTASAGNDMARFALFFAVSHLGSLLASPILVLLDGMLDGALVICERPLRRVLGLFSQPDSVVFVVGLSMRPEPDFAGVGDIP